MSHDYDIAVDFMDMTAASNLWARRVDVRNGLEVRVGDHVVVGDDDADPRVGRIETVDEDGNVQIHVLPGPLEAHWDLVSPA